MKWANVGSAIKLRVAWTIFKRSAIEYLYALWCGFLLIGSVVGLAKFWTWVWF